jgi:hypothetical protein
MGIDKFYTTAYICGGDNLFGVGQQFFPDVGCIVQNNGKGFFQGIKRVVHVLISYGPGRYRCGNENHENYDTNRNQC